MSDDLKKLKDFIYNVQLKVNKALNGKSDYNAKDRRKDCANLQLILKSIEKLPSTLLNNNIKNMIEGREGLIIELNKGDNAVDLMKIFNFCRTIINNI